LPRIWEYGPGSDWEAAVGEYQGPPFKKGVPGFSGKKMDQNGAILVDPETSYTTRIQGFAQLSLHGSMEGNFQRVVGSHVHKAKIFQRFFFSFFLFSSFFFFFFFSN